MRIRWIPRNRFSFIQTKQVTQKFRQIPSISLRFQDKQVFVFNTEIQDGRQKRQENDFREKSAVDSPATLRVKYFAPFPK